MDAAVYSCFLLVDAIVEEKRKMEAIKIPHEEEVEITPYMDEETVM